MMKTIGIIILVAVLGAGAYFVFGPKANSIPEVETQGEVSTIDTKAPTGKKMAFTEFVKQGGSYTCMVSQNVQNTTAEGTVYISNGSIRGEYDTMYGSTAMHVSTIVKDGYSYTWTSAMPNMGFKAKVVENAESDTGAAMSGSYSWNAETIGDYNCTPWTPDASKFVLPASVTFTDVSK